MTNTKNNNTFLSKLQTLKSFIDGMGIKASDDVLSDVLKKSGHNVELALERILTGNGSISNDHGHGAPTHIGSLATSSSKKRDSCSTGNATASSKKGSSTGSASSSSSASSKTPKSSMKRQRHSLGAPSLKDNTYTVQQQPTNRLLLCKRWTIASSRSTRGRVSYGEMLEFSQNWNNNHEILLKGGKLINPLVRFRSKSGYVEGTLNRYLCSILVPLLHLPATNHNNNSDQFIPLISIEGETLMEDRLLVIGSEVPLTLKVYINDPISFFKLFSSERSNAASSTKLFFQNSAKKKTSQMPSYQGKKAKSSFSDEELAEAAFHLLQWADKGEELPFKRKEETKEKLKENTTTLDLEVAKSNSTLENGDGDYEDSTSLASEQVDELNQLVVSGDQRGKLRTSLSELSDPSGFKKDIKLHAYQRQALHWMCRREGVHVKGEMNKNSLEDETGELDLLAELVSLSASDNSDPSIQVLVNKVSCDCGPVVVSDELLVSGEIVPVAEYGCQKERKEDKTNNYHHHPLWKRRYLATDDLTSVYSFYVNELLGISSSSPPDPPKQCNGGILADAMGLGKTIMLLALVLKTKENISSKKRPSDSSLIPERASKRAASSGADEEEIVDLSSDIESDNDDDESYTDDDHNIQMLKRNMSNGTTLVIAPLSLVSQWEEELATKTDLSHLMYYENKKATGCDVFSSCDVVVTTYGTVQSEYASWTRSAMKKPGQSHPLLAFDWERIILDEAHGIKNPSTMVSKACCMLKAESRWCVTGTPIQNSLQDVYGLLKFLRHEPWSDAGFWRNAITDAATSTESSKKEEDVQEATSAAFNRVRRVLAPIILRRTKDTLSEDGIPILMLPPIDHAIVNVVLSPAEREFYNALLERSQSVFEGLIKGGSASKSWFAIFSLLQRLRQACDHVSLTVSKRLETNAVARLKSGTEPTSKGGGSVEDGVDDKFLGSLLKMFKKKSKADTQSESSSFVKQVAESLTQTVLSTDECLKNECPICLDEPRVEDAIHTFCAHSFHLNCLLAEFREQVIRSNKKQVELNMFKKSSTSSLQPKIEGGSCPVCHEYVKISQLIQIKKDDDGEMTSKYLDQESKIEKENTPNTDTQRDIVAREALESALSGASSSKLQAVMDELEKVWTLDPGSKVLIFSQFLGFLDIIGNALKDIGVQTFRIDGSLSLKERVKMIAKFNKYTSAKSDSSVNCQRGSVFLVSMKAGGVGLNLVSASSVFILDPWWNQAIEDQCINRVHRIGQQAKVVRVRKFVVADSVEEKIVSLQGKKKGMANTILDGDGADQLDSTKPSLDDFKLLFG